jgi:predicted PurR-regulated permease PerM
VVILLLAVAAALILRNAFVASHRQLGWALACVIVAVLMLPFANLLDRYVPRWLALLAAMLTLALVGALASAAIIVNIRDGLNTLKTEAPEAAQQLEDRYQVARDFRLVERVDSLVEQLTKNTGTAAVGRALGSAGTYFVCGILTLFLLVFGPRMLRAAFLQVRDPRRRRRVERIVTVSLLRGRRYLTYAIAQAFLVGAIVGTVTWLLDLPAPFVLGAMAGAIGIVPTLGIIVGGLPALLVAAGLSGWSAVAIVAAVLIGLQVIEIQVVRKRVDRATLHLGPALPAIIALLGYELYGLGGAAFGVAALVFLIAWLDTIGIDGSTDEDEPSPEESGSAPLPT